LIWLIWAALHAHRDLIPGKPERDGLLKSVKSTYLEKLGAQWKTLLLLISTTGLSTTGINLWTSNVLIATGMSPTATDRRVSARLRAITINMLGSDVCKIAFFKEFEIWDQLRALYSSKSRWFEYYDLSVARPCLSKILHSLE
jgi:hypothetical protein